MNASISTCNIPEESLLAAHSFGVFLISVSQKYSQESFHYTMSNVVGVCLLGKGPVNIHCLCSIYETN